MDAIYRVVESMDWITAIIFLCLASIAVIRQLTTLSLTEYMGIYTSSRLIKITQAGRVDNYHWYKNTGVVIYCIAISLMLYKYFELFHNSKADLTDYTLILTGTASFLIFRHYLSRLVSNVGNFENILIKVDHARNLYRSVLSAVIIFAVLIVYYIFPNSQNVFIYASAAILLIILAYHLLLMYSYRQLLLQAGLYFILYLCTLEITPYLLLYKYITAGD